MLAHGKRSAAVGKGRPTHHRSPGGATEADGENRARKAARTQRPDGRTARRGGREGEALPHIRAAEPQTPEGGSGGTGKRPREG